MATCSANGNLLDSSWVLPGVGTDTCSTVFQTGSDGMSLGISQGDAWALSGIIMLIIMFINEASVQGALAPLSGSLLSPVSFSFGWLSFVFRMFAKTFSKNSFMPKPDYPTKFISGISGHERENRNWGLGRLNRNIEQWLDQDALDTLDGVLKKASARDKAYAEKKGRPVPPPREQAGLIVSIYDGESSPSVGVPSFDYLRFGGLLVAGIQLCVSLIPTDMAVRGDSKVFFVTLSGTILAFLTASLPRWASEKWDCPRGKNYNIITKGNGAQHAFVVLSESGSNFFNLEIFANLEPKMTYWTKVYTGAIVFLWTLLVAVTVFSVNLGLTGMFWLVLVLVIGVVYNIMASELPQSPSALGIPIKYKECFGEAQVMETLKKLELKYKGLGASLLPIFFPGFMMDEDKHWWIKNAPESEYVKRLKEELDLAAAKEAAEQELIVQSVAPAVTQDAATPTFMTQDDVPLTVT